MGRGGQCLPASRKGKNWETKASRLSQPTPLRSGPGWGGHSLLPPGSQDGQEPCRPGDLEGRAECHPATPDCLPARLPAPRRAPRLPDGRLHLPRRGRALPRWAPLGGWAAGARRAGLCGGRAAVGAGGREGRGPLYEAAAGRKEALVSQAGRIPTRGAHLSGQEPGRSRARPPERLRLSKPRPCDPTDGGGDRGGATPLAPVLPWRSASPPLQAPEFVAGCPGLGVAS